MPTNIFLAIGERSRKSHLLKISACFVYSLGLALIGFFEQDFPAFSLFAFLSLAFAFFTASTFILLNLESLAIFSFFLSSALAMNFIDFSPVKWYSGAVAGALLFFCCTLEKSFFGSLIKSFTLTKVVSNIDKIKTTTF